MTDAKTNYAKSPADIRERAEAVARAYRFDEAALAGAICSALVMERERWAPAVTYFERYCQDEADDVENCVCGQQQHEDAKAFAAVARRARP